MLNSLIRRGIRIALAVGITVSSWLGFYQSSLALPEPQVLQKLEQIPMFLIVAQDGNLVLINTQTPQGSDTSSGRLVIFGAYSDAAKMLDLLQKNSSDLAGKIKIIPLAFSRVYEMLKKMSQEEKKMPPITFFSQEEDMKAATDILQQSGKKVDNLQKFGIPLFFVTIGKNEEFIVKKNDQGNTFIPFYMTLKDAQAELEEYKKQFPDRKPEEIKIGVVPLLELVQVLLQKDEEALKIMQIIPSEQQINEANRLLQNTKANGSQ
uniref:Tic22 family protein n=2 Tax=Gloeothece TaxID=28070 RepID=E0U6N8_GLOV7|nr:Tic22 family protein [Gloeothece verrucosa PCC 7822]